MKTLRIGVLGAARIVKDALLTPTAELDGVTVAAIAARDHQRAHAYAARHGIPDVHTSYEDLLADPELDAVYVPLPAALHARWTLAALDAGKHVLCEKPFTSNAQAAAHVADRARGSDRVVMEAYHSHYHPLYGRLREIVRSGELGSLVAASAEFAVPIRPGADIRWNYALGGGGLLDVGYYPVRALTEILGQPQSVLGARARMRGQIDRRLDARLTYVDGVEGSVVSSIWSSRLLRMSLQVRGTHGIMRVSFPFHPHLGSRVRIRGRDGLRVERTERRTTYSYQLEAFRDAVAGGATVATDAAGAAENMRVLDSLYDAAGVSLRP